MIGSTRAVFRDLVDEPETQSRGVAADPHALPSRIGGYQIVRSLGRGGMGTVYEAIQERPRRVVALKVMHVGLASRSTRRRFEAEAELLGKLQHPGIAQIHDAGTHHPIDASFGPVPFFVMEYVEEAASITDFSHALPLVDRLRLFMNVCDAVEHGHRQGVLHRDLKPANILVDRNGKPKVIDFGVACSTGLDENPESRLTEVGQLLGTVQYMSTEQLDGDSVQLDARSDVYSLGVVLYELVCGQLPYDVRKEPIHEATRIIREVEPPRPSEQVRRLDADLETIMMKLLEKDRDRRYGSVAEVIADLSRYVDGEPIQARPRSSFYQVRTFARRNRALTATITTLFVVLVASLACISTMYLRVQQTLADKEAAEVAEAAQRQIADDAQRELDSLRTELSTLFGLDRELPDGLLPVGVGLGTFTERGSGIASVEPTATASLFRTVDAAILRMNQIEEKAGGHRELQLGLADNYELIGDIIITTLPSDDEGSCARFYERSLDLAKEARTKSDVLIASVAPSAAGPSSDTPSRKNENSPRGSPKKWASFAVAMPGEQDDAWRSLHREGRLLAKTGRYDDASPLLEGAYSDCLVSWNSDPGDPWITVALASIAVDLGDVRAHRLDFEGARSCYRQACDLTNEELPGGKRILYAARKRLVQLAAHGGDCDDAWRLAANGVEETRTTHPEELRLLAIGHAACGRFDQAVAATERALANLEANGSGLRRLQLQAVLIAELSGYRATLDRDPEGGERISAK